MHGVAAPTYSTVHTPVQALSISLRVWTAWRFPGFIQRVYRGMVGSIQYLQLPAHPALGGHGEWLVDGAWGSSLRSVSDLETWLSTAFSLHRTYTQHRPDVNGRTLHMFDRSDKGHQGPRAHTVLVQLKITCTCACVSECGRRVQTVQSARAKR
jgi:hypothetical protein